MEKKYLIGSKVCSVIFDASRASEILKENLSLYPDRISRKSDITIRINPTYDLKPIYRNPLSHFELENGFGVEYPKYRIIWYFRDSLQVDIIIKEQSLYILRKLNNIQYTSVEERIGHIFHESVIVPALLMFFQDITLMHASGLATKQQEGILFSGTGGVGKTTVATKLLLSKKYDFITDDMAILDRDGNIWSNYSFPKIYSYNLKSFPELRNKLIRNRSSMDKIQWWLKSNLFNQNVRRSVNPIHFFTSRKIPSIPLSKVYLLFRSQVESVEVNPLSSKIAAEISKDVILTEYWKIFRHLHWHNFNRRLNNTEPLLSIKNVEMKLLRNLEIILEKPEIFKINIPYDYDARYLPQKIHLI